MTGDTGKSEEFDPLAVAMEFMAETQKLIGISLEGSVG